MSKHLLLVYLDERQKISHKETVAAQRRMENALKERENKKTLMKRGRTEKTVSVRNTNRKQVVVTVSILGDIKTWIANIQTEYPRHLRGWEDSCCSGKSSKWRRRRRGGNEPFRPKIQIQSDYSVTVFQWLIYDDLQCAADVVLAENNQHR